MGLGVGFGVDWGSIKLGPDSGGGNTDTFIIQVNTANTGTSASNQFTLPWIGTYDVDWGDGNTDTSVSGTQTHTYSSAGTYDVSVTATTGQIIFNNGGDKRKLLNIKQWGTCQWTSMLAAFRGCSNMNGSYTDSPNLSNVTTLNFMFDGCTLFNHPVNFDTSNVTSFIETFSFCTSFNQPVNFDTSNITRMDRMLEFASSFDQDISSWQVTQVTNLSNFATGVTLSTANYDALLIAWDAQGAMSYSGTVNFGNSQYTLGGAAETARTSLIAKWGGIIDGGGVLDATTNLVASYNFDKDFTDYTGNNDAISHNSALISVNDYVVNKGLNNTQGTAYLTIPDSNDFSFTDGVNDLPFSISFWINFSTTNLQAIIWKGGGSSNREYRIQTADGFGNGFQIKVMSPTTDFISAVGFDSSPYSINTFYHLAFTYDGSGSETGLKIYVNGVDETTTTSQTGTYTGMVNSNFDTAIGVRGDTLSGLNSVSKIDELHIWKDRELSSTEVLEIYNTENGGTSILPPIVTDFTTNLVASYNFESGAGDYTKNNTLSVTGDINFGVTGGVVDRCADFYSANNSLYKNSNDFSFTNGTNDLPFSVSFWVNFDSFDTNNGSFLFAKRTSSTSTQEYQAVLSSTNNLTITLFDNLNTISVYTPVVFNLNTWYNIAFTYDGSSTFNGLNIYINGIEQSVIDNSSGNYGNMSFGNQDFAIGNSIWSPSRNIDGKVDEFHVWKDRELSDAEVLEIYNTENSGTSILPLPTGTGLLADYPNASGAYSLRNLISTNTNVVRVRRSSDNAEQDFSATEITDGTLTTFTGANDGFVTTWYDQSGNNLDIVQSTLINQPKIVSSGSVILENNKPAIQFNGTNSFMTASGFGTLAERSVFTTMIGNGDGAGYENYYIISNSESVTGSFMQIYSSNYLSSLVNNYSNNSLDITSSTGINTQQIVSVIKTTSTSSLYQNGSLSGSGTGTQNLEPFLGLAKFSTNYAFVKFQEFIIYNRDESANRSGIETNINNHYSIY